MDASEFNKRIEIWGQVPCKNEIGENDFEDGKIKTIWSAIIPQTGSMQKKQSTNNTQFRTILSEVTTKFKCRYNAGKDIKSHMWIIFKGKRHDIKYILNPYEKNEFLEIFCSEVNE